MSSAIENLTRLNNEISELVGELYAEFSDFEPGSSWDYTRTLSKYIRRVTKIGLSAGRANIVALQDACLTFQDSLRQLRDSNPVLSPAIRNTLEEWPLVALTVFESPRDPSAASQRVVQPCRDSGRTRLLTTIAGRGCSTKSAA